MKGIIYWQRGDALANRRGLPDRTPDVTLDHSDMLCWQLLEKAKIADELRHLANLIERGDVHLIVGEESCNHMFDDEVM